MRKHSLKKATAAVLSTAMVLSAGAVSVEAEEGAPDDVKVVIASSSDPGNYLPFGATNSVRSQISNYFYESLFSGVYGGSGEMVPLIATGYERETDGEDSIYTITINENVHDSQGNTIDANDVAFCYNKILEFGERTTDMGELVSVEALDDYTVKMVINNEAITSFPWITETVYIVDQEAYEASESGFANDPVGTGPYTIKEWLPGSSITLVRDDNYWGKDLGYNNQTCKEMEIRFIAESAQVGIELETGTVDFAYGLSSMDAEQFRDRPGFAIDEEMFCQVRSIGFNESEDSLCSNKALRQAICYAINAEAIVQSVYQGKGGVPTSLAVPEPSMFADYVESWDDETVYEYDLEKAKELMAEAGYPDGGITLRLMTKNMSEYNSTCEVMQAMLAQIGITVEILSYENALYQSYRYDQTAYDMYICQVAPNYMPNIVGGLKWYMDQNTNTGLNTFFIHDEKLQELLNAALNYETGDEEALDALWQYSKEECFLYPYAYTYTSYVHVDGMEPFINWAIDLLPNCSTYSADWSRKAE